MRNLVFAEISVTGGATLSARAPNIVFEIPDLRWRHLETATHTKKNSRIDLYARVWPIFGFRDLRSNRKFSEIPN